MNNALFDDPDWEDGHFRPAEYEWAREIPKETPPDPGTPPMAPPGPDDTNPG